MSRIVCALVLLLVFASAATGVQVHASTECERWIAEYREQLAHSDLMKRASAAHHRVHRYVHRRLAALHPQKPRVRVLPARLQRPKMTKEELLHELEFACGDLPLVPVQLSRTVHFDPLPDFAATSFPEDDVAGPSLVQDSPQGNVASNSGPSTGWNPGLGGGIGGFGGGGGLPPSNPGNPGNPGNPPPAVTPEPGSLLLVATGVLGVAGTLRRRSRSLA